MARNEIEPRPPVVDGEILPPLSGRLDVREWPLARIIPYPHNPRRISEAAVAKVVQSLKQFGPRQPIVVDAEGVIVVGHARYLAARHLGWITFPVHVARDMPPEMAAAYRIADNRAHEETEWDGSELADEFARLEAMGGDLDWTLFDPGEFDRRFGPDDGKGPVNDPDAEWQGMPEYVSQEGRHRYVIISFKDEEAVQEFAKLIGQEIGPKTKSLWHPQGAGEINTSMDERYVTVGGEPRHGAETEKAAEPAEASR